MLRVGYRRARPNFSTTASVVARATVFNVIFLGTGFFVLLIKFTHIKRKSTQLKDKRINTYFLQLCRTLISELIS